jgi:type II secretory pathway pseudopilin PulG
MNNQSQLSDEVVDSQLEDLSDESMKKGKLPLLGCLSIIFVFGILSAISMSHLMCDSHKARESEALQYLRSMNRAQQALFAENGKLANSIDALGIGIKTETSSYKYSVRIANKAAFHYAVPNYKSDHRGFVSAVFLIPPTNVTSKAGQNEIETVAILCVAKSSGTLQPADPTNINGQLACGNGTEIWHSPNN